MKGVDVSLFQFNWNVMLYAVFLDADGTIYARYGSPDPKALSTEGFRRTMERVLEAHAKGDTTRFAGKRGAELKWKTPETMPTLAPTFEKSSAPQKCIHCHHVWAGTIASTWQSGEKLPPQFIWPYPKPESIGLTLEDDDPVKIRAVAEGSPAAKAGARAGDMIAALGGQTVLTIQDVEWVLHHGPDKGSLDLELARDGGTVKAVVELAADWRRTARRPVFGVVGLGARLVRLTADERKEAGILESQLALRVTRPNKAGLLASAGVREGDVLVSVDGRQDDWEDDQFIAFVRMNYTKGAKLKLGIFRRGFPMPVELQLR